MSSLGATAAAVRALGRRVECESGNVGDPAAVVAESAVFQADLYRGSLFTFFVDAGDATLLARFGQNQLRQLGDPTSVVRSVQYGMPFGDSLDPRGAASGILITTITYRVMSLGGDTITIGSLRALGDTGPLGDVAGNGSTARVVIDSIPEPRSALLLAMGLAGLRITRSRRQSV